MPDIIHIDMDCFFAAVEVKDNPDLAGKPVIVGALPGTRGVVSAASYEARKYGVHSAMPISKAYRLCPGGVYLPPNGTRYVEESARIMAIFREFTPLVEPLSLDEAFLDVAGSHRLFGPSEEIGRAIKRRIRTETGLVASVGIAPTKFVAKIASDLRKPDGFVVVREDEVREFLRPLDIRKIWGVGPKTASRLERRGLRTIGDIADVPAMELERMFGRHGLHLHSLANGIDGRPVIPTVERKQVSNEHTFDVDIADRAEVERALLALCDKVAGRLLAKGLSGRTVTLKLRDETFRTLSRARSLDHAVSASADIYRIARDLFRAEDLGGLKVRLIGVGVTGFDDAGQLSMFDTPDNAPGRVDRVMADIRKRFGKDAITRASLAPGKMPETPRKPPKEET
jgi:nucleotidyltransferase/DNA polymerase involved in DNA repair